MFGLGDLLGDIGSTLWQGAKNVGDFIGLDGKFGYQGTWSQQPSLGADIYSPAMLNRQVGDYTPSGYIQPANYTTDNSSLFGSLGEWLNSRNSQDWKNYADIAKSIGGLGLGYLNYKNAQDMTNLYKQQMAFNQAQINDANNRRKKAQQSMANGFQGSSLGTIR